MSKSTLIKEDLQKLSVKQLEKFATGVTGDDLELVNEVIVEKRSRLEQATTDPNLAKEVEESKEAKAAKEAVVLAKKEAADKIAAEKAEAKLKIETERAEKAEIKKKAKEDAVNLKLEKLAEKELGKTTISEQKAAVLLEREAKKAAREEAKIAALAGIEASKEKRAIESAERAKITAEKLADMQFGDKVNKTQAVRNCLAKGMSNAAIAEETGFTNKFICDTVWRIEQMVAQNEFIEKRRAEIKAAKDALVADAFEHVEETQTEG